MKSMHFYWPADGEGVAVEFGDELIGYIFRGHGFSKHLKISGEFGIILNKSNLRSWRLDFHANARGYWAGSGGVVEGFSTAAQLWPAIGRRGVSPLAADWILVVKFFRVAPAGIEVS